MWCTDIIPILKDQIQFIVQNNLVELLYTGLPQRLILVLCHVQETIIYLFTGGISSLLGYPAFLIYSPHT